MKVPVAPAATVRPSLEFGAVKIGVAVQELTLVERSDCGHLVTHRKSGALDWLSQTPQLNC